MQADPATQSQTLTRWFEADPAVLDANDPLVCVRDGGVAHVVLNRPAKRNPVSTRMWTAIALMMRMLDADPSVRLVVLRGAGPLAFSAGADISEFAETYSDPQRAAQYNLLVRDAQLAVQNLSKPTLAVVQGLCVGGGCGLALACDLRFAAQAARFGITPSKLGAAYSITDTRRLVTLVGTSRAKDILFSGRLLGAGEASAFGLVDRVIADADLETETAQYARMLLANSSESITTAKAFVNALSGLQPVPDDQLQQRFDASFESADFREGYQAFIEKRRPRFN